MRIFVLAYLLVLPFHLSAQTKLYKSLISGMNKAQIEKILSDDISIQQNPYTKLYDTFIWSNKMVFNLMFNESNRFYGLSFWTDNEYDAGQYSVNIPPIINEFSATIEENNGNPTEAFPIPEPEQIRRNGTYCVKYWWDGVKYIHIDIENTYKDDIDNKYYIRLTIIDNNFAPKSNLKSDF